MDEGGQDKPPESALVAGRSEGGTATIAARWSGAIAAHQHRVVMSLVAAGFSFDRASELANEAWARLIAKDRDGVLAELKLPGLAIVQARFLAGDERRREAMQLRHRQRAADETALVDDQPGPEERLNRQKAQRALDAVATAPVSAQRLMRLLYAEPAMPHARAAQTLGLSVQRVRQILGETVNPIRTISLTHDRGQLAIDPRDKDFALPTPGQNQQGRNLWVAVTVCVAAEGHVTSARIVDSTHPEMDAEILRRIKTWTYRPELVNGQVVSFCTDLRYEIAPQFGRPVIRPRQH